MRTPEDIIRERAGMKPFGFDNVHLYRLEGTQFGFSEEFDPYAGWLWVVSVPLGRITAAKPTIAAIEKEFGKPYDTWKGMVCRFYAWKIPGRSEA